MPRRLVLRCYACRHGQIIIGPHPDPVWVEREAWAFLRRTLAHLDRKLLVPERRLYPHGGLVLKVRSQDELLPVEVIDLHALLTEE